jgi:hypothetical protein
MTSPGQDPRLLSSVAQAKVSDVESRLNQHIETHPPAAPALAYSQTPGQIVQTANGTYTWTVPAGVFTAKIECFGAGAGGGGGASSRGGEGGGGGEYACEPAYPLVPGQTYTYVVGNGGTGGTSGNGGQSGTDTIFDTDGFGLPGGVFANGGTAGNAFTGGPGGGDGTGNANSDPAGNQPSQNSIRYAGGAGGGTGTQGTGGCGGGESGGAGAAGASGLTSSSSTGVAGGSGGPGGNGGAGGNAAANGAAGAAPGGGGGGAGANSAGSSGTSQYRLANAAAYYGSDATGGNANQWNGSQYGTMYQGGDGNHPYEGTMKSVGILGGTPQSDLSGKTIDSVTVRLDMISAYYASAYIVLGYANFTVTGLTWNGVGTTQAKVWYQGNKGSPVTTDLTATGLGAALQSGAAKSITLGRNISSGFPADDKYNYCSVYGPGGDNNKNPLITVTWHTGATPSQAGAGSDGKIVISYTVTGILQAALQPVAGGDDPSLGNTFAQGYTGPVQAFQPGTSPAVVETWHTITLDAGWTAAPGNLGTPRYRLLPDGNLQIAGGAQFTGGFTPSKQLNASNPLPAAYRPPDQHDYRQGDPIGTRCHIVFLSTGVFTCYAFSGYSSGNLIAELDGIVPLS